VFGDGFSAVHTHQLEFVNVGLPTLVCRVHWFSGNSTVMLLLTLVPRSALDSKALQTLHQGRKFQKSPSLSKEVSIAVARRLPRLRVYYSRNDFSNGSLSR